MAISAVGHSALHSCVACRTSGGRNDPHSDHLTPPSIEGECMRERESVCVRDSWIERVCMRERERSFKSQTLHQVLAYFRRTKHSTLRSLDTVIDGLPDFLCTPYTLHSTPYNPHPKPYTLNPSPYTLNPSPYTLHPQPFSLHPTTLHTPFSRHYHRRPTQLPLCAFGV